MLQNSKYIKYLTLWQKVSFYKKIILIKLFFSNKYFSFFDIHRLIYREVLHNKIFSFCRYIQYVFFNSIKLKACNDKLIIKGTRYVSFINIWIIN